MSSVASEMHTWYVPRLSFRDSFPALNFVQEGANNQQGCPCIPQGDAQVAKRSSQILPHREEYCPPSPGYGLPP